MTTNDNLLGQDDIDSLLDQEEAIKQPDESEGDDLEALLDDDGNVTEPEGLGQDDLSALLDQDGNVSESIEKPIIKPENKSDGEANDILTRLYNRAYLKRDEDVKIIWNASGVIPMNSGLSMEIEGIEYISLGVLHENHLVVGYKE